MRRTTRRTQLAVALIGTLVLGAGGAALSAPPPNGLPTTMAKMPDQPVTKVWPRFDAKGKRAGSVKWRVTTAGGNCCEVLVAATRTGRLVEFGGTYPAFSDDKGKSWTEVVPLAPSTSRLDDASPRQVGGGEGTIVMAPGGDIVGVGWDPYSGDRLQPFLYDAETKTWVYSEHKLHEPFYDREWIAVAKGPFTIAGQTVPWVSLVLSNFNRRIVLISIDGLNYVAPTQRDLNALANVRVEKYLDPKGDPDLDYMQEQAQTGLVPVAGGGALSFDNSAAPGCETQILKSDGTWACFGLPEKPFVVNGSLHTDARGWLHDLQAKAGEFLYRISKDGGRSWTSATLQIPGAPAIDKFDFKAHGKLGLTAIVAHAKKDDKFHQQYVMRVNTKSGTPKLVDTMLIGDGNWTFTVGLDVEDVINGARSDRVDFATIAILPDGTIAAGFADKTYHDPALAIMQ